MGDQTIVEPALHRNSIFTIIYAEMFFESFGLINFYKSKIFEQKDLTLHKSIDIPH